MFNTLSRCLWIRLALWMPVNFCTKIKMFFKRFIVSFCSSKPPSRYFFFSLWSSRTALQFCVWFVHVWSSTHIPYNSSLIHTSSWKNVSSWIGTFFTVIKLSSCPNLVTTGVLVDPYRFLCNVCLMHLISTSSYEMWKFCFYEINFETNFLLFY